MSAPRQTGPARSWRELLEQLLLSMRDELVLLVFGAVATLVRAMGVKITSGWTGLRFTFGRAGKELQPGFHPLIPFAQRVRKMPTRSRTLDLPMQRVVNRDGLVYHVDANLVYRVVDVRKALIEIDNLEKGMIQMLGLGVQETLRAARDAEISNHAALERSLAENLAQRLAPWGVEVERVGFPSISPSAQTLRITQLGASLRERLDARRLLTDQGVHPRRALGLVGTRQVPRQRGRVLREREATRRRTRHLRALAKRAGWNAAEIKQAEHGLRARLSARARSRARAKA